MLNLVNRYTTRNRGVNSPVDRVYEEINIDGNATVIIGDNYGTLISHHDLVPASIEAKNYNMLLESLSFEGMGARLRNVDPALSRTCQWLRNHKHFLSWAVPSRQQNSNDFLWLKGKPGSGKSTIMRNTLLWLQKECPTHVILSYFFDARSPFQLAKSTLGLYRSFLFQLFSSDDTDIRDLFLDEFSAKLATGKVDAWTEKEIQNFLINLVDAARFPRLTMFIDALDESRDDDIQELVGFLEDLQRRASDSGSRLRILLSSRHYPHVSSGGKSIVLEDQPGHEKDITHYVQTRLLGAEDVSMDEIRQTVLSKASGVFLWVALMVSMLNRQFNRGEGLSAMKAELERASAKVQDLFYDILTRDQDETEDCVVLLRCVLYAKRTLSAEELYRAVRNPWRNGNDDTEQPSSEAVSWYLLTRSRGLVELTKSRPHTVQLIHETLRETLTSTDATQKSGSWQSLSTRLDFRAQTCHATIAEACLKCLLSVSSTETGLLYESASHFLRVEAFASYAAEFWWQHMQEMSGTSRQYPLELASSLLQNRLTRSMWTSLCGIIKNVTGLRTHETVVWKCGTPLYYAAWAKIPELVREFTAAGADVDVKVARLDTPLRVAACLGHEEIVQILLEAGANIDRQFYSPLVAAASRNHKQVVTMLLEHGVKVDRITSQGTALTRAASEGHEEIVRLLLDHGADANTDNAYLGPLQAAIEAGHTNIARLLLENGADIQSREMGQCILDQAFKTKDWELVELLLEYNAEMNPDAFNRQLGLLRGNGKWRLLSMLLERKPTAA